jgi:putative endonuclease
VYILRCSDKSLYCGITTDVNRRVEVHNTGMGPGTLGQDCPCSLCGMSEKRVRQKHSEKNFESSA